MQPRWLGLLITVGSSLPYVFQVTSAQLEFSGGANQLKRFICDESTNRIYIGAVNSLYILNDDFTLTANVSTGPELDSRTCTFLDEQGWDSCPDGLQLTDNHNKVLVLHNDTLLTCGSIFQGTCERRNIVTGDVTEFKRVYKPEFVLAATTHDDEFETVAFVYTGPKCNGIVFEGNEAVLYKAQSAFHVTGRDNAFDFLSSHQITSSSYLEWVGYDRASDHGAYSYFLNPQTVALQRIVRSGFGLESFTYFTFLATVNEVTTSWIAQVCVSDCGYYSYVEIPLSCSQGGTRFELLQRTALVRAGQQLATELGISTGDHVMVAAFTNGGGDSAVCAYSMAFIRSMFTQNMQACNRGEYSTRGNFGRIYTDGGCTVNQVRGGYF